MATGTSRKKVTLQRNPDVTADIVTWSKSKLSQEDFDLRDTWVARLKELAKSLEV